MTRQKGWGVAAGAWPAKRATARGRLGAPIATGDSVPAPVHTRERLPAARSLRLPARQRPRPGPYSAPASSVALLLSTHTVWGRAARGVRREPCRPPRHPLLWAPFLHRVAWVQRVAPPGRLRLAWCGLRGVVAHVAPTPVPRAAVRLATAGCSQAALRSSRPKHPPAAKQACIHIRKISRWSPQVNCKGGRAV